MAVRRPALGLPVRRHGLEAEQHCHPPCLSRRNDCCIGSTVTGPYDRIAHSRSTTTNCRLLHLRLAAHPELYTAWPSSARWEEVLRRVAGPSTDAATTMGGEAESTAAIVDLPVTSAMAVDLPERPLQMPTQDVTAPLSQDSRSHSVVSGSGRSSTSTAGGSEQDDLRPLIITDFPSDLFNAELADYLNGTIHYGLLDGLY